MEPRFHFGKWTRGDGLPPPARVWWWGEVNWAVRTAVDVNLVKGSNEAEIKHGSALSILWGHSTIYTHNTYSYIILIKLLQLSKDCWKSWIESKNTFERGVTSHKMVLCRSYYRESSVKSSVFMLYIYWETIGTPRSQTLLVKFKMPCKAHSKTHYFYCIKLWHRNESH